MWWWLLLILVMCLYLYSRKKLQYFSSRGVCTLPPVPLLGNLTDVTFGRENFVEAIANGYNAFKDQRYFGLYQYLVPTLVPRDPELIRQIMVRDFQAFSDRGVHIGEDCDPLFGRNLIMLRGASWRAMRCMLSPAFSAARGRGMAPLMAERACAAITHLRANLTGDTVVDVNRITTAYVNDVIASCAFGFSVDSLQDPQNIIFRLGQKAIVQDTTQVMKFFGYENMKTVMKLFNVKIIKSCYAQQFAHLFKSALNARRDKSAAPRPDFIQTLVDATQGTLKEESTDVDDNSNNLKITEKFTDDDLVSQAVLFYVAGYDTTANLINYFLLEMAANPHLQDKLQAELDAVPIESETEDVYDMVQGLEYLDMCVSEVLRLWPLVGSADRRSVEPYDFGPTAPHSKHRLIAGPGIHVWLPIYSLHRDPQYWPHPDTCDPTRFSPQNRKNIVPYTYLPFGTGPRHCIGSRFAMLAAKLFLMRFFRVYSVRAVEPVGTARLCARAFILRPRDGFSVVVVPRNM